MYQLEEEQFKKLRNINSRSSNIHRGEFELLVERTLIFEKQKDYAAVFTVVAERLHGSDCLKKVNELFLDCYSGKVAFMYA